MSTRVQNSLPSRRSETWAGSLMFLKSGDHTSREIGASAVNCLIINGLSVLMARATSPCSILITPLPVGWHLHAVTCSSVSDEKSGAGSDARPADPTCAAAFTRSFLWLSDRSLRSSAPYGRSPRATHPRGGPLIVSPTPVVIAAEASATPALSFLSPGLNCTM